MTDNRLNFSSAGAVRRKPLWKMTDVELEAIADSDDDPRADDALAELSERASERRNGHIPEDTPSLDAPWWAEPDMTDNLRHLPLIAWLAFGFTALVLALHWWG